MTDRKAIADALSSVLWNYVAWGLVTINCWLAAMLVKPVRRALDRLTARLRPNRNVGITPPAGSLTLGKFRQFADRQLTSRRVGVALGTLAAVMTPAAGTLGTFVGTSAAVEGGDRVQGVGFISTSAGGNTARGTLTDATARRSG